MKRTLFSLLIAVMIVSTIGSARAETPAAKKAQPNAVSRTPLQPSKISLTKFAPLNFHAAAVAEAANPPDKSDEIEDIEAPQPKPDMRFGVPIPSSISSKITSLATPASATGPSPGPVKSFKAEFLTATSIPPDTMGAVGTTHIVSVTNDRLRIQTRDGIELSRMTLTSFWAGVTIKGAAISAFDPKVMFDRFNNRFILISSGNGQNVNSGAMFAVSQTADPTGTWNRWSVAADPSSTAAGGHWIDYPTLGFNKKWIVVDENVFNFGTAGTGYWGQQIYVLDKQAAYSNTLGTISLFQADFATGCVSPFEGQLGCGFTMAPSIVEDNTTDEAYMIEDWDNLAGQLRLSKLTGTASTPVLTVGTQFPQSTHGWVFNAARIITAGTQSGGYLPQRQQSANLVSGSRIMANDSRIQNAVLRNGSLWCTHTVMLAPTPTPVPSTFGTGNPDTHSGVQWWEVDPTIETGAAEPPIQRARIEDPTADNCHNGAGNTNAVGPRCTAIATQSGEFFAFPNISVNQNDDVLIGFTRFSALTYPNSGYAIRRSSDPINTTRDPVIFRPGQANYNIGAGSGAARQNRWGDYSASQTDPLNDTDFWSVQEYAGTQRNDFLAPTYAGPWETWWALIRPTASIPSPSGSLIISEFRLRGPQGVRDEFVEVYNPGATPVIVNTSDNSDGWALVYSNNGTTVTSIVAVIPNGTVIPPRGHFLLANNPDNTAGGTSALTYSLNTYPSITSRPANSDTGWAFDLADNGGIAIFKTMTTANFNASTRMDSVGFASIAAGFFREGAGIPAVTAATPTGQMTFYRDSATGTPVDTDANENDFIFADPVIETLGTTPRLGAAGPENLNGPIHDTGGAAVVATLLDAGAGQGSPANLFRDPTVVANGAFGTITFRRTFTNNTGADLPRLRYRIVNITTNPVVGAAADLRALSSVTGSVTLSGGGSVSVNGTTLETPPAQAVGGAFNSSYSANGVALATPLLAGASVNLAFTLGVQVTGTYNFCLVAEGEPVAASSVLCFAGTTENTAPSITPGAPVSRTAGGAGSSDTIATVSDGQDSAGSLTVTATSLATGITVTSILNTAGTVTATVTAGASAVGGPNNVTLQVADSEGATSTDTFVVNVIPATPTATPGGPTTFCAGGSVLLTSSAAAGNQWYLDGNPIGGETNQTYSATATGAYTVVVTENASSSAPSPAVNVTVNPLPPTPTITPGGPTTFCTGGSVTLTSSSASGNQWYLNGNPIGGETNQTYIANASGDYTVVVTDGNGCPSLTSAITTVTVNPIPPTPTITPSGSVIACDSGTLTSSSATGNQWYFNGNLLPGETNQTLNVDNDGDYTVVVTLSGCSSATSAATSVDAHVRPGPAFLTAGGPTTFCAGGSVTLSSNSATGIQWYLDGNPLPNPNNQNRTVSVGGTYTVTLNNQGCISNVSNSIVVTVNPLPATPTITPGGPTTFCAGGSVALNSSSASGNQWYLNGNPIGGATNQVYSATASGNYTVRTTDGNNCTSAPSAATTVTVNPIPATPTITPGGPTTFCAGGSVTLSSSSASGNQWNLNGNPIGGATNPTFVASVAGDYTVTVTTTGCTSAPSATTTVTVNPNPNATITAPASVVTGSTGNVASVANAGVGATYSWTIANGTITGGSGTNSITFTAGSLGTLTLNVTVTTSAGCSDSKLANVSVATTAITVSSVTPANGSSLGGTSVTIAGTGFNSGATVAFGGSAATNVVRVNSAQITAKTPAHAAGAVNVTVTNTDTGTGTLNNGYTYNQQNFDPNGDSMIDPSDIFYLVAYLFTGGPAPAGVAGPVLSGDANGDGVVDPADIFYVVNYLFGGGNAPFSRTPGTAATTSVAEPMSGALTLGQAVQRNGHWFVPVIVMMDPGSSTPQAFSLRVRMMGEATDAVMHRGNALEPIFEISRRTEDTISYLVAFNDRAPFVLGDARSAVIAEIEFNAPGALRLEIDPVLTMLVDGDGTHKATVANHSLRVSGTSIGRSTTTPRTQQQDQKLNEQN